ncbi:MAG: hypothetical protein JNK89_00175 [Saprospiraceae bacterium]|nr:hypothetical protein [Saprospiraceae bacterium]
MPNRKLLEITHLLTSAQTKRLRQFLAAPFFNHGYNARQIQDLFDRIVAANSEESDPQLDKKTLSRHFFPGKTYRERGKNPIDSLASDLLRQVKFYLTIEDVLADSWASREHLALARFYRSNNLEERFWQNINQWRKTLAEQSEQPASYHLQHYYLEEEVAAFSSTFNTYTDDANLLAAHRHLDTFYTVLKLEYACALNFQRQLSPIEAGETARLIPVLVQEFQHISYLQSPLALLYHCILQLFDEPENDSLFSRFEQLLQQHRAVVEPVKYRNLQAFYRYFAGKRYVRYGGSGVLHQLFELYNRHLQEGYFSVDGKMLPGSLKVLVNIGLKLDKTSWVEQLLRSYGPAQLTGTRYPVESHSLCVAELLFHKKSYAEAREHLIFRHFENINYSILADVLLIKIYYKTQDELLDSRMKALVQKVRRARISPESKTPYFNFLKKLDKIIRYVWEKKPAKIERLALDIQSQPAILEREWLLGLLQPEKE